MMEFLVRTTLTQPLPADAEDRRTLLEEERAVGRRLLASGSIRQIWRIPGQQANIAVMAAEDATELHELITSLPLFPYTAIVVEALADHPLVPDSH